MLADREYLLSVSSRAAVVLTITGMLAVAAITVPFVLRSDSVVLTPDDPHRAADSVTVPGGAKPTANGGIFYLDVQVTQPSLGDLWLAKLDDQASIAPLSSFQPPGTTASEVRMRGKVAIDTSKSLAGIVALRALGETVTSSGGALTVNFIDPRAPAYRAGLRNGMGIEAINGTPTPSLCALRTQLRDRAPGDHISLRVLAGGQTRTIDTVLVKQGKRAIIGLESYDETPPTTVKLPRAVKIETGDLGGPSAGLAFALEIFDQLSARKLSSQGRVAVTGTISSDGCVGPIGGIRQKTFGALRGHASVLSVPAENAQEAKTAAAGRIKVVSVNTFRDALKALGASAKN